MQNRFITNMCSQPTGNLGGFERYFYDLKLNVRYWFGDFLGCTSRDMGIYLFIEKQESVPNVVEQLQLTCNNIQYPYLIKNVASRHTPFFTFPKESPTLDSGQLKKVRKDSEMTKIN